MTSGFAGFAQPQPCRHYRIWSSKLIRYIRHPLYCSLLLLAWGVFLKDPSLLGGGVALIASAALVATAKVEEAENLRRFGDDYAAYMKTTKMFLPFLF
jgi:protein-S-isoprenylcysteine O-methyltransferase Ste14